MTRPWPSPSIAVRRLGLLIALCSVLIAMSGRADTCKVSAVGVAPALADSVVWPYETRGYGQVFVAPDTVLQAITVWRPAVPDTDWLPWGLVITEVDSTGQPDVVQVLGRGPALVRLAGDGVNPVDYRFVFDPPLALPRRGRFFFDVFVADCFGAIAVLASFANPYLDGQAWFTFGNRYACGYPTHPTDVGANLDLVFKVEFCGGITATRRASWGVVKTIYR